MVALLSRGLRNCEVAPQTANVPPLGFGFGFGNIARQMRAGGESFAESLTLQVGVVAGIVRKSNLLVPT